MKSIKLMFAAAAALFICFSGSAAPVGTNDADALAVVLSPSVTTLTIADPLVGFYYSLKQGGSVTNLLFNAASDRNKLGGRDAISFDLTKPEDAGFCQTLITPSEYAE